MKRTNTRADGFFIVLSVITILSGLYLIWQKDYVIGMSGTVTGLFLLYIQMTKSSSDQHVE